MKRPRIRNRRAAMVLGYGGVIVGSWALWEAYERRGKTRPFWAKFVPSP